MEYKIGKKGNMIRKDFDIAVIKTLEGTLTFHYKNDFNLKMGFQNVRNTLWQSLGKEIVKAVELAIENKNCWIYCEGEI